MDTDPRVVRGASRHRLVVPSRMASLAAVTGGLLWVGYGLLAMLRPLGIDVVYREELGYSVVVAVPVFVAYNLPGSIALVLTSIGLLGITPNAVRRDQPMERATRWLAYVAVALGVISLASVVLLVDPVFTTARIFGTLALGAATVTAAVAARQSGADTAWVALLGVLGILGLLLFPLWPLVYMLTWFTETIGALVFAVFGIGWLVVGWRLRQEAGRAGIGNTAPADP